MKMLHIFNGLMFHDTSLLFLMSTDNMEMRFGGLVSTSNIVKGETVTVRSDSDLLWTISLKKQTCS
ncbi:putative thiamine diphosphokinase [Helianthus annuus]|nr:putative thiamine diphosphokinase [Helianthus annuus]